MRRSTALQLELNRIIAQRAQQTGRRRRDVESRVRPVVDDLLGSSRVGVLTLLRSRSDCYCSSRARTSRDWRWSVRPAVRMSSRSAWRSGASPAALARQLFAETLMLSIRRDGHGHRRGRACCRWSSRCCARPCRESPMRPLTPAPSVFTSVIGLLTAFASSIAPAARVARSDLEPVPAAGQPAIADGGLRHPCAAS
jgi:hypothetical protein